MNESSKYGFPDTQEEVDSYMSKLKDPYAPSGWCGDDYELTKDEIISQLKADMHIVKEDNKKLVREVNRLNGIVAGLPEDKKPKPSTEMRIWKVEIKKTKTNKYDYDNTKSYYVVASDFNDVVDMVRARGLDKIQNITEVSGACEVIY